MAQNNQGGGREQDSKNVSHSTDKQDQAKRGDKQSESGQKQGGHSGHTR